MPAGRLREARIYRELTMRSPSRLTGPLLLAMSSIAFASNTPGSYTHYAFDPSAGDLKSVDFGMTVESDPGYRANVFWSNQFSLVGGQGGYTGMQSNGGEKRMFLFSLWNATEAKPGSSGSYCLDFGGEGVGKSCRMAHEWQAGHTYRFYLAFEGDQWLGVTVTDMATHQSFKLGSIRANANDISPRGMVDWTEYFEWNAANSACNNQPYSRAVFALPSGDDGRAIASISAMQPSKSCASYTEVVRTANGSVQRNAIGNSSRGPVSGEGGRCMEARQGPDGRAPVVAVACHGSVGQAWVYAVDRTLRLEDNTCLDVVPGATAMVVTSKCTGDAGQQWDAADGQLRNSRSGLCLAAPPAGAPLTMRACSGMPAQHWQLPSNRGSAATGS